MPDVGIGRQREFASQEKEREDGLRIAGCVSCGRCGWSFHGTMRAVIEAARAHRAAEHAGELPVESPPLPKSSPVLFREVSYVRIDSEVDVCDSWVPIAADQVVLEKIGDDDYEKASAEELTVGTRVAAWYGAVADSCPAIADATTIVILRERG